MKWREGIIGYDDLIKRRAVELTSEMVPRSLGDS